MNGINFLDGFDEVFKRLKSDSQKEATLSYGFKPEPWVTIQSAGKEYKIPLPPRCNPYGSWAEFFINYIEIQVGIISKEYSIVVKRKDIYGKIFNLNRHKLIEDDDD